MHVLFSWGCIPDLAWELLRRFGEMLLSLWPVSELGVMWRTPDSTCRLPSGFPFCGASVPASTGMWWTLDASWEGVCCTLSYSKGGSMQVFSCCLVHVNWLGRDGHFWWGANVAVLGYGWIAVFYWIQDFSLRPSLQHHIWARENWFYFVYK